MKISEDLLNSIKAGKPVDTDMIPGHISTPKIPDSVFDITCDGQGREFKRAINPIRWIEWIESIAAASADENADIHDKSIMDTKFYNDCRSAYYSIIKHRNNAMSGAIWIHNGNMYSISLIGDERIDRALHALAGVKENSIEAKTNNRFQKFRNRLEWETSEISSKTDKPSIAENIEYPEEFDEELIHDYEDIVSGRC